MANISHPFFENFRRRLSWPPKNLIDDWKVICLYIPHNKIEIICWNTFSNAGIFDIGLLGNPCIIYSVI